MTTGKPKALIFRQRLFVRSETFIPSQVKAMKRYEGIFLSRFNGLPGEGNELPMSLAGRQNVRADRLFAVTGSSRAFRDVVGAIGPKVVHAHFGPDGMLSLDACREHSVPLVVTLHGRDVSVRKTELLRTLKPVAVNYALKRTTLAKRADVMICVSDDLKRMAIERGFPERKLTTHYIGIDTEKFTYHGGPRHPRLLHVARLVEKKGTDDLLSAFARIAGNFPDASLDIVGDGPLLPKLVNQAERLGLKNRVVFHGMLPNDRVRLLLRTTSAFVLPSVTAKNGDREGLPISILEAMSAGAPVISTFHSGIPEAIPSDRVGLLVGEHQTGHLAERIEAVLSSAALVRDLGRNGSLFVREHFNLKIQTQKLESLYDSIS